MRHHALAALAFLTVSLAGGAHAALAQDKVCALQITANDTMLYDKKELDVPADCTQVRLTLTHVGKLPARAMGQNWVLVRTQDVATVANAGRSAQLHNDYLVPNDSRVIAATHIIGGGQSTTITFPTAGLSPGGDYTFLCTFPGHSILMKGVFKFG
jgi:azurin